MELHTTVGLSRFVVICGGRLVRCSDKVSCTYRCSDHCHGLQHAEVLRVDVSSDILSTYSFVRHATAPWHWLGRREREGVPTEALPRMSLMDATYTHMGINRKQSAVYVCMPLPPQTCNADQRITKSVTSYIHSYFEENKKL